MPPAAAILVYVIATLVETAWPGAKAALSWFPAIGAFSGKIALASLAFAAALSIRLGDRSWVRAVIWLPGFYVAAVVASFPPVTEALARTLREALPWLGWH
jgi:hypothetical protein